MCFIIKRFESILSECHRKDRYTIYWRSRDVKRFITLLQDVLFLTWCISVCDKLCLTVFILIGNKNIRKINKAEA